MSAPTIPGPGRTGPAGPESSGPAETGVEAGLPDPESPTGETAGFRRLFGLALLAAVVPLWVTTYPPMVDLPQHAAQVATGLRWADGGFDYPALLEVNRTTPYLLAHAFVSWLARGVGVGIAFQVVLSLAVVGVPLATWMLVREVGGDPRWALAAIPVGYSFAWFMGFVSFVVATPLALLFLVGVWRYARAPTRTGGWLLVLFLHGLFATHVLLFGWAGLLGAGLVALRSPDLRSTLTRWWPFALSVLLPTGWLVLTLATVGTTRGAVVGEYSARRLVEIPALVVGMPIGATASLLGLLLLLTPLLTGGRAALSLARWLPVGLTLLLFVAAPYRVFGTSCVSHRYAVLLVPTLLFAFDRTPGRPGRARPLAFRVLGLAVGVWIATLAVQFWGVGRETGDFRSLIAEMEPSRRVLYLPIERESGLVPYPVYLHFGSWYQVERGGLVEFSFASFFPNRYRFGSDSASLLPAGFGWWPWHFDWTRHGGERYDYLLYRSSRDPAPLVARSEAPADLVARADGGWWLYRVREEESTVDPGSGAARP